MSPSESFYFEIKFSAPTTKKKHSIQFQLENLMKGLALHLTSYKIVTVLGDFNIAFDNGHIDGFCDICGFNAQATKKIQLALSFFKRIHLCSFAYLRQASLTYRDPRIINHKDYKQFQNYVF